MTGFVVTQDNSANDFERTTFQLSSTTCQPTATKILSGILV